MSRFEDSEILMEELKRLEMIAGDDFKFAFVASKRKDDDEVYDEEDDDFIEDEEDVEELEENPFDKEPTEQDIIENDIPLIDPEDDLLDEEEEVPYN